MGAGAIDHPFATVFWSGVVAGWLLALIAWLVTASHWTTGQALITWAMTFILGLGKFAHCVRTAVKSCRALSRARSLSQTTVPGSRLQRAAILQAAWLWSACSTMARPKSESLQAIQVCIFAEPDSRHASPAHSALLFGGSADEIQSCLADLKLIQRKTSLARL
jgi:hypothetical protein